MSYAPSHRSMMLESWVDSHEGLIRTQEPFLCFSFIPPPSWRSIAAPPRRGYTLLTWVCPALWLCIQQPWPICYVWTFISHTDNWVLSAEEKFHFLIFLFLSQADARFYRLKMNIGNFIWANQLFTSSLRVGTISYAPQNAHLLVRARDKQKVNYTAVQ